MSTEDKIKKDIVNIVDNVNLVNDEVMKPISLALCTRLKRELPQVSFSKEASNEVETIEVSFKFDLDTLSKISKDPVSEILQLISDEFVIRFKPYNLLTINFCGIYKTDEIGKFKVIFKLNK